MLGVLRHEFEVSIALVGSEGIIGEQIGVTQEAGEGRADFVTGLCEEGALGLIGGFGGGAGGQEFLLGFAAVLDFVFELAVGLG